MAEPERIILERAEDGERWRMRAQMPDDVEGHVFKVRWFSEQEGDVEGHAIRVRYFSEQEGDVEGHMPGRYKLSLEPDGEDEQGEPLFRLTGEDTEGHAYKIRW